MNYSRHYEILINRARSRQNCAGYMEKHHVQPKCLGGSDSPENIVRLTAEEHFVAHQLLVKINPGHKGLAMAAWCMTAGPTGDRVGNKKFGWLRRRHASAVSDALKGREKPKGLRCGAAHPMFGKKHTDEARAKMSAKVKGDLHPLFGVGHSDETKTLISLGRTGEKNPCFGKSWATDGAASMLIKRGDPLPDGWAFGRPVKDRKKSK